MLGGIHDNPTVVWTISQGAGLGTITGNTFTAGNTAGQVTIQAVVGFCSESITFNINEGPQLLNTDQTICSGEVVSIPINSSPPGASYTWTHTANNVSGGADGTGTSIDQTLTVTSGTTGTVVYSITATLGACTSTSDLVVTVNEGLVPNFNPVAPICNGEVLNPLPTTSTNGITGVWSPALDNTQTTTYTFSPDAGQCSNPTTLTITVNPTVTPTFAAVSPICENSVLSPLPTSSQNGVIGSWSPALDNTQTTTYTFTPDAGQCSSNATLTIQVNSGLNPTFDPIAPVCFGEVNNPLPASSLENVTGTWSPSWDNTQTTDYTFTPTAGQCAYPATLTVSINALPIIDAGVDQAVCTGNQTTLTGSPASITNFAWDNNVTNGTVFTPAATTTYTLTGIDANGCENTDQVTVTVNQLPVINAGADQSICTGNQIILTGSPASVTNFTWSNGVTNGVAFTPAATTTYTVTGTDANGCVNSDQVTVTVNPLPVINAGADQSLCIGGSVTLNGSGGISYEWTNNVTNGVPFNPITTASYTVTGTDINGCENTDEVIVTISPNPPVNFDADISTGCSPLNVGFSLQSQPGISYNWSFGDGTSSTAGPNVNHEFTGVGCFDITLVVTTADGCISSQTLNDMICLAAFPEASFHATSTDLNFSNYTTTFVNTSTGGTSYLWDFGDFSQNSTLFSPTHSFPNSVAGNYEVVLVVTNASGCADTAKMIIGVQEEELIYVPNSFTPDDDQHNPVFKPVLTTGYDPTDYTLLIYNRWGELIFESHDADHGWNGTYSQSHERCQDGTYTWTIEYKSTIDSKRVKLNGHVNLIR